MFMYAAVGVPKPFDDESKWSLPMQELVSFMIKVSPKERLTADELMRHPVFRNKYWKKPAGMAQLQRGLASIWPSDGSTSSAWRIDAADVSRSEMELAHGMANAASVKSPTGQLLDEDMPRFLAEALPSAADIGDLD
jgi:hypothetical protein